MRETVYASVDELKAVVDIRLNHHNEERPHRGHRDMGKRSFETVNRLTRTARPEAQSFASDDGGPQT